MEDTGIAVGFFTKIIIDISIDDIVPNTATDQTWDCAAWAPYNYFSEVTDKEFSVRKWWN
jgi:hypothetical protein